MMLWIGLALAGPPDQLEQLSSDARINWSWGRLELHGEHAPSGTSRYRSAVEADAARRVSEVVDEILGDVPITATVELDDLLDTEVGKAAATRAHRWELAEAHYSSSGSVWLRGELSLATLLGPWISQQPKVALSQGPATGLILDARGIDVRPVWAPELITVAGESLWDFRVTAVGKNPVAPVVWVSSAAHPAAARAGEQPLILRVMGTNEGRLVVDTVDALGGDPSWLAAGVTAIVVDP